MSENKGIKRRRRRRIRFASHDPTGKGKNYNHPPRLFPSFFFFRKSTKTALSFREEEERKKEQETRAAAKSPSFLVSTPIFPFPPLFFFFIKSEMKSKTHSVARTTNPRIIGRNIRRKLFFFLRFFFPGVHNGSFFFYEKNGLFQPDLQVHF